MKSARSLGPSLALLLLFGACVGALDRGGSCACGGTLPGVDAVPAGGVPDPEPPAPTPTRAAGAESAVPESPDLAGPEWTRVESRAGTYEICWRALGGEIPRNADFALLVWVLRDGAPVRDAHLTVSAWMPAHGHGMLRRPRTVPQADGSFRVEGMLLHMRGHWELFFEVLKGTLSETTDFELEL